MTAPFQRVTFRCPLVPWNLCLLAGLFGIGLVGQHSLVGQTTGAKQDLQHYEKEIKPLLVKACFDCHSGDEVEGNFSADKLNPDLVAGPDIEWWLEVYSVISKGEMPPEEDDLPDDQRALIVDWLASEIQAAEKMRKSEQHSSFRRLTRYEYNYALQDLLGVSWNFSGDMPSESSEEGAFENNADSLRMSVKQVEAYQELAVKALQRVTVRGEQSPMVHWSIPMKGAFKKRQKLRQKKMKEGQENPPRIPADETHYLNLLSGERASAKWHYRKSPNKSLHSDSYTPMPEPGVHVAVVKPGGRQALTLELDDSLPDEGTLRVRIRASRAEGVDCIPSLQLSFGFRSTDQGAAVKRVSKRDVPIEAAFGEAGIYQWDIPLGEIEHRNPYRGKVKVTSVAPSSSEYIRFTNSTLTGDEHESSDVLIEHVQISAPFYEQWPPQHHRNLFLESENTKDETAYAREIIASFMARAWRRPPADKEVDRKLKLFQQLRPSCQDFPEAIVEVLATVLASPKFLYVCPSEQASDVSAKGRLSQHELATRLSLFLWCSLPDETLNELAAAGRLAKSEVLHQQVERMLADPRAERFHQHFVVQWLKMQPLEFLSPSKAEDGLDATLLESMKREPIALFADMLKRDSSVLEFIDADYSVVNERLAQHYGIVGVQGNHFRRVDLTDQPIQDRLKRGGLLTQAGMLTMNSDGEDSHPVKRGVWLLTNLLNDPPPPPPAAVPEIDLADPEILKMTLKQRIENHRDQAACLSCHQKIDPWGIAFENYDALGRWRDEIDERIVDASSELPGNVSLDGVEGLKKHIVLDRQDQFVRATLEKMAAFALGRQLDFGERSSVSDLTKQVRDSGDGIKTMVFHLVKSELFQSK